MKIANIMCWSLESIIGVPLRGQTVAKFTNTGLVSTTAPDLMLNVIHDLLLGLYWSLPNYSKNVLVVNQLYDHCSRFTRIQNLGSHHQLYSCKTGILNHHA